MAFSDDHVTRGGESLDRKRTLANRAQLAKNVDVNDFGPGMKVEATSGEDRLIGQFFRPLAKHPGAFGLTDDAAVITTPEGASVVFKIDAIC